MGHKNKTEMARDCAQRNIKDGLQIHPSGYKALDKPGQTNIRSKPTTQDTSTTGHRTQDTSTRGHMTQDMAHRHNRVGDNRGRCDCVSV